MWLLDHLFENLRERYATHAEVLAFLAQAFNDLGFAPAEADLRARILLSANIAPILTPGGKSRRSVFKRTLEILVGSAGSDAG